METDTLECWLGPTTAISTKSHFNLNFNIRDETFSLDIFTWILFGNAFHKIENGICALFNLGLTQPTIKVKHQLDEYQRKTRHAILSGNNLFIRHTITMVH